MRRAFGLNDVIHGSKCCTRAGVGFLQQAQGGAGGAVRTLFADQLRAQHAVEVCDHRPIAGNAAAENNGRANGLPANEGIDDVAGHALAQAIADLRQRKAFLLGVSQIGLGEDGAAGGDFRRGPGAPEGDRGKLPGAGEIQTPGLLIEEAAGAGRAGGVGLVTGVAPGGVELNEAETLAADMQDGPEPPGDTRGSP